MALATCTYLAHVSGSTALLAVIGNASYVNCGAMRTFLADVAQNDSRTDLAIDFSRCQGLDSTVLGLIAMVAMELTAKAHPGRVVLANLDGRNLDLVKNLGLHHVCEIAETPIPTRNEGSQPLTPTTGAGAMCQTQCLLEAHEALVRVTPENETKFHDVIESLKAML